MDKFVFALSELGSGESRGVGTFWLILTDHKAFKAGDTAEIGEYVITASKGQGNEGMGSEVEQLEITKKSEVEEPEKAGSVVAAEESEQPLATVTEIQPDTANIDPVHDRPEPVRRYKGAA